MLHHNNYLLVYKKNENKIIILLPQTFSTVESTDSPVVNRRINVDDTELIPVLLDVEKIFTDWKECL